MTIKLTLLIKLLLTASICYVIEQQLHDTPEQKTLAKIHQKISLKY